MARAVLAAMEGDGVRAALEAIQRALPPCLADLLGRHDSVAVACERAVECTLAREWGAAAEASAEVVQQCERQRADGGWDCAGWQEACIFAHLCAAAALMPEAATDAVWHVDRALMVGAPAELCAPLLAAVEPLAHARLVVPEALAGARV